MISLNRLWLAALYIASLALLAAAIHTVTTKCRWEIAFEADSGINYDVRIKPRKVWVCDEN